MRRMLLSFCVLAGLVFVVADSASARHRHRGCGSPCNTCQTGCDTCQSCQGGQQGTMSHAPQGTPMPAPEAPPPAPVK